MLPRQANGGEFANLIVRPHTSYSEVHYFSHFRNASILKYKSDMFLLTILVNLKKTVCYFIPEGSNGGPTILRRENFTLHTDVALIYCILSSGP